MADVLFTATGTLILASYLVQIVTEVLKFVNLCGRVMVHPLGLCSVGASLIVCHTNKEPE